MKKVLVLGATGAMGTYLVPELLRLGYRVDGVTLDDARSDDPNLRYLHVNMKEDGALEQMLSGGYDGIVDFMIWRTSWHEKVLPLFLGSTDHYIYLSSYRIYDGKEVPTRETSPRLIDSVEHPDLVASDDYCIHKARGENFLRASGKKNFSIVRPAITYSRRRFQLVTLEADTVVNRALDGKPVILPRAAMEKQATMSWGGDVGRMIARLLFRGEAMGETFSVTTAEHHTWREIADYYHDLIGLNYIEVSTDDYLSTITDDPSNPGARWQLEFDRLFDRVMDNSKILSVVGMKQEELMPLYAGLQKELSALPAGFRFPEVGAHNALCDEFLKRF